jgi:predicted secreted protein
MQSIKLNLWFLSLSISATCLMVILSFKQYFFFSPFERGLSTYSIILFVSLIGWILLLIVPPILLRNQSKWSKLKHYSFLVSVSLWTLGTVAVKIYTLVAMGSIWAEYLMVYPILAIIEWVVPAFYVLLAFRLRKNAKAAASIQGTQKSASH